MPYATKVVEAGKNPIVVSPAEWGTFTMEDFASYAAIVLGDPTCKGIGSFAAAEANTDVWGPALTGNIVLIGTDPTWHSAFGPGGAAAGQ